MNRKLITTDLSEEKIKEMLEKAYDVGTYVRHVILAGGLANTNICLETSKSKFLMKICDDKNIDELKVQMQALEYLKQSNYYTSYPVQRKDSKPTENDLAAKYIYLVDGNRIILFDWLSGSSKPFEQVNEQVMRSLAVGLGKLNTLKLTNELAAVLPQFGMGIATIDPWLKKNLADEKWKNHPFVLYLHKHIERLRNSIVDRAKHLPQAILHGDCFPDNALFEGDNLVAIIDWEEICQGAALVDVAVTICGCCFPKNNELDEKVMNAFLENYEKARKLTEEERKLFNDYLDYAILGIAWWRFRQFNQTAPDERLKDKYVEMVERLAKLRPDLK